ncbi:MAG: non-canonical purine NTP pyrophosphatase, partial [Thermoprotei archaeon]
MRNVRRDLYELIFVTRNRHKFMEVSRIAEEFGLRLKQYDKEPKLELQHERQELIVLTAASTALLYVNKPLIIEDSGLYIKYLNG